MKKNILLLLACVCIFLLPGCNKETKNNPDNPGTGGGGDDPAKDEICYADLTYFYTEPYLEWDGSVSNIKSFMKGKGWTLSEETSETLTYSRELCSIVYYKNEEQILYEFLMKPADANKLVDYVYGHYTQIKKDKYLCPDETETDIFVVNNSTALVFGFNGETFRYYEFPDGEYTMVRYRMAFTTPGYMKNHQIICGYLAQYLGTYLRQGTFIWPSTWTIN